MNKTGLLVTGLIFAGFVPGIVLAQSAGTRSPLSVEQFGRLPLAFEKHGAGSQERFVARGQGYTIGLEGRRFAVGVAAKDKASRAVSLEFVGAQPGRAVAGRELPGKVNYIRGNDPRKWQIGLATYERVTYPNAYPGIDVIYYGNQQQLEFDLLVKPGADPGAIRLKAQGADRLSIDGSGALNLGEAAGGFRLALPRIYQEVNGEKLRVPGHYAIVGRDEVAFRIDPWDHTHPLVIDPTVVWSVQLGGGLSSSGAQAVAVDPLGNVIVAGYTYAADFPLFNPAQDIFKGTQDVIVTKINPAGTALLFSTYYGGSGYQYAEGLALDSTGAAWVTGFTTSTDLPTMNAAQSAYGGGNSDAFVAKFSANGALQVSTYLGGNNSDYSYSVAVDGNKNAYVTGSTYGPFPTTAGVLQPSSGSGFDGGFVAKYSVTGTEEYSTLFGGNYTYGQAIAVDSLGSAYVTGVSYATIVPGMPAGSAQPLNKGGGDAYVAKINPAGTAYGYFTFLGGMGLDQGKAIVLDSSLEVFVAGQTSSTGLATSGAAYKVFSGAIDGFAAKINPAGSMFDYITYLPVNRVITLSGMALDATQDVYLTGWTDATNFPAVLPLQSTFPGNGISLFSSTNSGGTFAAADSSIPGAVFQVSINPSGASEVALTEAGIYRSVNGGASWSQEFPAQFSSYGAEIARSPVAPETIYASLYSGIYRSTDDGVDWTYMGSANLSAQGLVADPLTAGTLYMFGSNSPGSPNVFKSTDGGKTWTAEGLPVDTVTSMVATSDGALYAGGYTYTNGATNNGGIYKSTNQGGSWSLVETGLPSNSYPYYKNGLSASGTTVYFAQGNIYKTTNGGASWASTTGYAGAYLVAASPQNASDVYAFTYSNTVEESTDGGATWSSPGAGLPNDISYYNSTLEVDPSNPDHVLVIAPVNQAGFVAKLNSTGSALDWSTYLGGTAATSPYGIATDGPGNVLVAGSASGGFPVTSMALPSGTSANAFITKISDATAACGTLTFDPESALVSQYGGTLTFDVSAPSGCAWTATTNESWAPITSGASGTGVGTVTIQAAYNSTTGTRTANLTVGAQNVTISQPSESCTFKTDKASYPVLSAGGGVSVILTATAGCQWIVMNNYRSAISFTTASFGTGSATIGMIVGANMSASQRNFYLSVGTTSIQIVQGTAAPVITGISDAADNSAPPLSGGGLSILYGMNLATGTAQSTAVPAPFTLGGSTLTVNGYKAAMSYASPSQINFQMPYEVAVTAPGTATVEVSTSEYTSQAFTVNLLPASPGIFGSRILNTNGTVNTAGNPIAAGGTATVFYTGAGAANPPVGDGKAAPASPLSKPVYPATATVGGLTATVSTNEFTPGSIGAAQANVVIPSGLTIAGSYPVIITANGRPSAPAMIYISGAAPVITKVAPLTAPIGSGAIPVTITGTNFGAGARVQFTSPGGAITLISPSSIQPTQITVLIPATLLTVEGAGKIGIDDALGGISNHFPFTITPPVATTTTLVSSANPAVFGHPLKFTATVTPLTAVGNMTISDGSFVFGTSPLVNGVAEFSTTLLPSGSQSIKADFLPPGGFLPSASAVLTQIVKAAAANDFAAAVNYATGTYPSSLIGADFNHDGKADLAVTNESGVQIFLGKGDGTFGLPISNTTGGYGATLTAGDFNRDGNTDLAVAYGSTIFILPGNGDGTFGNAMPYTLSSYGLVSIVTGDFNGDGKLDLAALNSDNGTVAVLLGNGDGTFGPAMSYNSGASPTWVAIGDFNGDGKADLVVTNSTGTVNVLLGKGDGTFPTAVSYPAGSYPYRVSVADLNGDGKLDLAIANEYYGIAVLKGNGDGTFGNPVNYGVDSEAQGIAVGDINGDGKPDIVIASSSYNAIGVLFGNGDLTFQNPVSYAVGSYPQPVVIADLNGDGRSDIAVANQDSGNLSALLGLETTGPLFTSTLLTSSSNPSTAGQSVYLTAHVSPSTATGTVTFKNGTAVLGAETLYEGTAALSLATLPVGTDSLTAVYSGDPLKVYAPGTSAVLAQQVNKSPTNTVLFSSLNPSDTGQSVTLRAVVSPATATGSVIFKDGTALLGAVGTLSGGSATFTVSAFSAGTHSLTAVYSGDADDAPSTAALKQTVYSPRATTTTTQVSSLNPSTFGQAVTFTATVAPAAATGSVTFYDGQSVLETEPLAAGKATLKTTLLASGKREIRAFYGGDSSHLPSVSAALPQTVNAVAGNGFAPAMNYGTGNTPFAVAVGDFNGDGKADLAIAGYYSGNVSVLLGKGDGTFGAPVPYSTASDSQSVAVGDFNGDGKPDLAVTTTAGVGILLGKGDGTFQPVVNYSGDAGSLPLALVTTDFNGDGHADIATVNSDGTLSVLPGAGDGTFAVAVNFGAVQDSYLAGLVTADFNGDGIPDLATAAGGSLRVFLGNGDGSFRTGFTSSSAYYEAYSFVAADVNGDGKTDLAIPVGSAIYVLLGKGDGTFQAPVPYSVGTNEFGAYSAAFGDFNGDGKVDLVVTNYGSTGSANVLLGKGDGTFQPPATYATGATATYSVAVADLNGDGRADIVTANYESNNVSILLGILTPTVNAVTPSSALVGSSATAVTIAGSNFLPGATVSWKSPGGQLTSITPSVVKAAQISATIPLTLLGTAGTAQIAVTNGANELSNAVPFYILPFNITAVTPVATPAGSAATQVTVTGTNLSTAASLVFTPPGGTPVKLTLTTIQPTKAVATIPSTYLTIAGAAQIALANAAGAASNALPFYITPFTIATVTPNSTAVGSAATKVTVTGTNLSTAAKLAFTPPGASAPVMIALSTIAAGQAVATIPAQYLTTAGSAQVALANEAGVLSNPLPFTILPAE
jgi:uncharacterized protein (TIGR03437 family)